MTGIAKIVISIQIISKYQIREHNIQIFSLQEIRGTASSKEDQITFLSKILPEFHGIYQKASDISGESDPQEEGNLKFKLERTNNNHITKKLSYFFQVEIN